MATWEVFGLGAGVAILILAWVFAPFREFLLILWDYAKTTYNWFMDLTKDKPMAYMRYGLFLFFLLFIANTAVSSILGTQFYCIEGTNPYQPTSLGNGITLWFLSGIQASDYNNTNLTESEYNAVVAGTLVPATQTDEEETITFISVECSKTTPRLSFLGLDLLSYQIWVLLIILTAVISLYFKFR